MIYRFPRQVRLRQGRQPRDFRAEDAIAAVVQFALGQAVDDQQQQKHADGRGPAQCQRQPEGAGLANVAQMRPVTRHRSGILPLHRRDQRRVPWSIDLLAQPRDMHVDEVGARIEIIPPHAFEDDLPRDDLAGIAHQEFQQAELHVQQPHRIAIDAHLAPDQVHLDRSAPQHGGSRFQLPAPTQQDFHPHRHLVRREGLDQIVVAPGAQPVDPRIDHPAR
jgi:hypothetical protein